MPQSTKPKDHDPHQEAEGLPVDSGSNQSSIPSEPPRPKQPKQTQLMLAEEKFPVETSHSTDPFALQWEERLRRLEDSLAQLQDLNQIESRVAERVATQIRKDLPAERKTSSVDSAKARATNDAASNVIWSFGRQLLGGGTRTKSLRNETNGHQTSDHQPVSFLWSTVADLRAMVYMFVDPRYSAPVWGRGAAVLLVLAFLFSAWWAPGAMIPLVGWLIVKVFELLVAFVLIKVLTYEARRYRQTAPDLPSSLRL